MRRDIDSHPDRRGTGDFFGQRRSLDPYKDLAAQSLPHVSWWKRMPLEALIIGGASFVLLAAIILAPVLF